MMNFWNLKAPLYAISRQIWPMSAILRQETALAAQMLESLPALSGWGLDLASGPGHSYSLLPSTLLRVGVDRSSAMARRCQAKHCGRMVVADVRRLPFKSALFSLITAIGLTEYLPDLKPFIVEVIRIVRPQGSILLTVSPPSLYTHLRFLCGHRLKPHTLEDLVLALNRQPLLLSAVAGLPSQELSLWQKK